MKDLFKELILEKGKELAAMGAVLLLVALGAAAIYLYTQGGTPFVPEEINSARSQISKDLVKSIKAAGDSNNNLKELLILESEGNTSEVLQKAPIYKVDLSKIEEPLLDMPQEIQTVADHIPEVRPRSAGKALSGAMNAAAQASMELLRLRQDSVSLYDGLEARARGEEFKEYKTIADRIKRQGDLINSLYDEFKAKIDTFKTLTSPKPNEQPS
ncbi:MAG: hypothetical protein UX31_C0023G0008 [Candidatus Nomurabacteria bacterium GW2011_GWA1_46_11]|uniref:Uncharacterized protein n=1 Tax=Candidatus Nomurabacteria bacterium GW2011_GWA1_46_11 TaxID=1618732 RepID=A0A0G1NKJ9_9BACT|nr:MAG: hypothetical protein UX31_C0023G0008 [Candidatus Nomurabacteria bacterium GW2011_GWA1_46_11]